VYETPQNRFMKSTAVEIPRVKVSGVALRMGN